MAAAWQSELEQAEEFNGQFTDVFNKSEHTQVPLPNRSAPFLENIHVSAEGVTKRLKGLNPSKALGPDELLPRVLKELASELGPMFAHLFQQSNDTGEIPKEWSLVNICPLCKKGYRSLACTYRPISLTFVPCKLQEIYMANIYGKYAQILWHTWMKINSCQIDNMHSGKKHSCETQMITVKNAGLKYWIKAGRSILSLWTSRKRSTHPLMNYLNVSYMAMVYGKFDGYLVKVKVI